MITLLLALGAGLLIGLSLGTLGAGGSILAVPVLVHLLGQSPAAATTGSLVVVGVSALFGAAAAARGGRVLVARGISFALVATGGSVAGAFASTRVPEQVLMLAFAALMLLVGVLMVLRLRRPARQRDAHSFADPVVTFSPTFTWDWPRALKVLLAATVTGLLTGFLGVGGGFLVVPALVLALGLPMRFAAGTSLVVIALTSAVALSVRAGVGAQPAWDVVAVLTVAAALASILGTRIAGRLDQAILTRAFTGVVLVVGAFTGAQALTAL
ncbi:sulfite exporter TauE/SafE family protein [Nocardioides gilvus]|uniref:sulfite exporter TauE/SafE family protein n=1 Tax=Nocardioides gilvus TaxID=1735589 RepID=UPI001EF54DDE|nr:sulfite exporter TauE/SafE family protein [Nocardioides gilvus]